MAETKKDKEELDLIEKLENKKQDAISYLNPLATMWREEERFYEGNHWKNSNIRPVKNWIFSVVEGEVPILTDSRPGTDILAREEQDQDKAKMLESGLHFVYENQNMDLKVSQAVRSALKTGTGWLYIDWDPEAEGGEGGIVIRNFPWKWIKLDSKASEIEQADYCCIEIPISVDELKRKFPKKAELIKPQKYDDERGGSKDTGWFRSDRWFPSTNKGGQKGRFDGDDVTVYEEHWHKDYSMEAIPQEVTLLEIGKEAEQFRAGEVPDVGQYEDHKQHIEAHTEFQMLFSAELLQVPVEELVPEDLQRLREDPEIGVMFQIIDDHIEIHKEYYKDHPKAEMPIYPEGWRLTIKTGDIILDDGAPEIPMIPLVPVYCYKDESSIYGVSEIRHIISPQKSYNEMDYKEYKGLSRCANPGWVLDENSGVDETTLTSDDGIIIKKKQGTEVKRLEPGVISPQIEQRKTVDREAIEAISGIHEVTQGRRPVGVTAAKAIGALREQAIGRIRLKTRYLEEYSMPRAGWLVTKLIARHWNSERFLRVYNKNGEVQYVKFNPNEIADFKYDIRMAPGSTAGLDKESIFALMESLFTAGVIDARTLIETTDMPHKATILKRLEEKDELNLAIQALQEENLMLKQAMGAPMEGAPQQQNVAPM